MSRSALYIIIVILLLALGYMIVQNNAMTRQATQPTPTMSLSPTATSIPSTLSPTTQSTTPENSPTIHTTISPTSY